MLDSVEEEKGVTSPFCGLALYLNVISGFFFFLYSPSLSGNKLESYYLFITNFKPRPNPSSELTIPLCHIWVKSVNFHTQISFCSWVCCSRNNSFWTGNDLPTRNWKQVWDNNYYKECSKMLILILAILMQIVNMILSSFSERIDRRI